MLPRVFRTETGIGMNTLMPTKAASRAPAANSVGSRGRPTTWRSSRPRRWPRSSSWLVMSISGTPERRMG